MKAMTCQQLGGPCGLEHRGESADEVIQAQDEHLKDAVAGGDTAHQEAADAMQARWADPAGGMAWYEQAKAEFAALPES